MLEQIWLFIHGSFVLKLNLDLFRCLITTGKVSTDCAVIVLDKSLMEIGDKT